MPLPSSSPDDAARRVALLMATTAEAIAQLEAALPLGEAEVRDASGQSVKYRSTDEILTALAYFRKKAAEEAGAAARPPGIIRVVSVI